MSDVFISYSRRNSDFARRMTDSLTLAGKDTWVDWFGIPKTAPNWWNEIKTGIEAADSFVFIMSPDSMASVVCNMELDYAIELHKRIVPVMYREIVSRDAFASIADFEPDESMEERLAGRDPLIIARDNWQRVSHINWVFFREEDDFDTAFDQLIGAVETDLAYVKAHTRYLTRAKEWARENQREDLLLFGSEIDRAEEWLQEAESYVVATNEGKNTDIVNPLPQDLHREYIRRSRRADTRRKLITRGAVVLLVLAFVGASLIGSIIVDQKQHEVNDIQGTSDQSIIEAELTRTSIQDDSYRYQMAGQAALRQSQNENDALAFAFEAISVDDPPSDILPVFYNIVSQSRNRSSYSVNSHDIEQVAFSPNDFILASLSCSSFHERGFCNESEVKLIDVVRSLDLGVAVELVTLHIANDKVNSIAFSPRGDVLATAGCNIQTAYGTCTEGRVQLWNIPDSIEKQYGVLQSTLHGHRETIISIAFSPEGTVLASSSKASGWIILWDLATSNESGVLLSPFTPEGFISLDFSPDGQILISTANDTIHSRGTKIRFWDMINGSEIHVLDDFESSINEVAYSPTGKLVATSSFFDGIKLWDTISYTQVGELDLHSYSMDFSPDGRILTYVGCIDVDTLGHCQESEIGFLVLGKYETKLSTQILLPHIHTGAVTSIVFSPDGQYVASGSSDGTLKLWDSTSPTSPIIWPRCEISNEVYTSDINDLRDTLDLPVDEIEAISPDGSIFATSDCGNESCDILLWDVASQKHLLTVSGAFARVASVVFSPDNQILAVGGCTNMLRELKSCTREGIELWQVKSGTHLITIYSDNFIMGSSGTISRIFFSPDGYTIAAVERGEIVSWSIGSLPRIRDWAQENRYIREFTCDERTTFNLPEQCDDTGIFPTRTPYPSPSPIPLPSWTPCWTLLPTATETPLPTLNFTPFYMDPTWIAQATLNAATTPTPTPAPP